MSAFVRLAEHKNSANDYLRARELRQDPTSGEQILWAELRQATRGKKFRFRRQHPVHPYIVDFVCLKIHLIVEVDGMSHDVRVDADKRRDEDLQKSGYEVMRFTNEDVLRNREGVVTAILNRAEQLMMRSYIPLP